MNGTRRFWALGSASGLLAVLAVLAERPVLLSGSLGVAGLLVALQMRFLRSLRSIEDALTVEQRIGQTNVRTKSTTPLTLTVRRADGFSDPVTVTTSLPPSISADGAPIRVELGSADTASQTSAKLTFPVAGTTGIDGVTVEVRDRYGLFAERLSRGETTTITVEPRRPRNVHVGQGGERTASTLGGHRSGKLGQGIDAAELREYVPGDTVSDIDWKATARLGEPHVREYEVETDQRTLLFFDRRSSLALGPEGETMLAYLQEVALALAATAQNLDDPLGLYAVGNEGTTAEFDPSTDSQQYELIRSQLLALEPMSVSEGDRGTNAVSPGAARRRANRLDGSRPFDRTLRQYLESSDEYLTRLTEEPLFRTVKKHLARLEGSVWSLILTDDMNRSELTDTVNLARRGAGHVVVFVTPQVLFEPGGLADLEGAYERYRDFEEFRREIDQLQDVTVFEVGPGDRIEALLASRRRVES